MNSITLNVHSERNLQLTKSCVQRKNNCLRGFDHSLKCISPRVRRHLSCEDCVPSYKQSIIKEHALKTHTSRNTSEFYGYNFGNPNSCCATEIVKENQRESTNTKRIRRGKSANSDCPKLLKAKFNKSVLDVKDSVNDWVSGALRHPKPRAICLNDGDEKSCSKTQNNEKKSLSKIQEKRSLKNELLNFENCCCELLLNSKYSKSNSYKTALHFYKLLLTLYHSIHSINKKYVKDNDKHGEIELNTDNSVKCMNKDISITSKSKPDGNIVTNASYKSVKKFSDKTVNSNAKISHESGDDIESQLNKIKNQLVNSKSEGGLRLIDPKVDLSVPIRVDNDKLRIGELLSYPKVRIKSKSVVRIYKDYVEEQYLISALRNINKDESLNLTSTESSKTRKGSVRYKSITAACSIGKDCLNVHIDQSVQTMLEQHQDPLSNLNKFCHASSQTNTAQSFDNNSKVSFNVTDEKAATLSWRSDNLSNDDFCSKIESKVTSPIPCEDIALDLVKSRAKVAKYKYCENVSCESICQTIWMKKQVAIEYIEMKSLAIDNEIPVFSSWTVHGVKVRGIFNRAEEMVTLSNEAVGNLLKGNVRYQNCNDSRITVVRDVLPKNALPTYCPSKSIRSIIKSDKDDNFAKDRNSEDVTEIALPESLNSLYERLEKLQKMLELVPEENISSTIEALEHIDSVASNNSELKEIFSQPTYPTSLGDCSEQGRILRSGKVLKTENSGNIKSTLPKIKEETKSKNDNFLEDDQSDATTSISMLENLIDDFLSKNGISNLSNI